jgi:predicted nucleic acid-binding protein
MSGPDAPVIYLDVCCLNRPFDDQNQERIRLESEAVLLILERCEQRDWKLVGSEAIAFEVRRIADGERRQRVTSLASVATTRVRVAGEVEARALDLEKMGFAALDALHIACAEAASATVLLTTDDSFVRRARRRCKMLTVVVTNPTSWLMEVTRHADIETDADKR